MALPFEPIHVYFFYQDISNPTFASYILHLTYILHSPSCIPLAVSYTHL